MWDSLLGGAEGGADGAAAPSQDEEHRQEAKAVFGRWAKFASNIDWRAEFPDTKPQIPANKAEVHPLKHLVHPQPSTLNPQLEL